jgi:hypothetical protein
MTHTKSQLLNSRRRTRTEREPEPELQFARFFGELFTE